ncbi:hypothetical protein GECvBN7_gp136c [Salmonella phage GEC_vB_N7]|uniref:Uncharacterized protein n=1 Tax=Salmonella phage GEC_vB_N7 TaxID=2777380 RepID=A0A7S9SS70_9CAUD|nr:hypothetical protein GECvBN7_gp136c [Salmonella phage GEC_vB_N7]
MGQPNCSVLRIADCKQEKLAKSIFTNVSQFNINIISRF